VTELTLQLRDAEALRALYDQQLSKGRAFLPEADGVSEREPCELVLAFGGKTHRLLAEAVFVRADGPSRGVGLQLAPLGEAAKAALAAFVDAAGAQGAPGEASEEREAPGDDAAATAPSVQQRIRSLSLMEQQRLAASGNLQERVVLERTFGANVWEPLLGNPRLTIPEVARIARKGTLPRPLVEDIAGHPQWLAAPDVQRALLSNPRATPAVVSRVLQSMSRADLQLVPQQTAYPATVRAAAKKMLGK
jgi:hypothetical protein